MSTTVVFDEVNLLDGYFQREPSVLEGMFEILANSKSWVSAKDQQQVQRSYEKLKCRRERENCQHGRRSFPIRYANGVLNA